ncbi:chymotrypsin-like protease CTRL-1 [Lucilia cuprina]|uniref:chymotrypsin-like protease CTRL-1 n=1 Tax=Lucilia cuprina TaxID=7375 RepID=UPI001F06726C|nr:chymotrypsin-like protease CTRL-1 [Lucilia cuprina]
MIILGIIFPIYLTIVASYNQNAAIIDGKRAELGQFPWHVLLRINEFEDEIQVCGGSIISEKFVLTAAHCFYGPFYVELVFGTIELDSNDTTMVSREVFIHPEFEKNTFRNDIAVIELPEELEFTDNIQPIQLVTSAQASNDFIGTDVIITGYGRTLGYVTKISDWLLWASLEIVNNSVCDRAYNTPMRDTEMCAIGLSGSDMSPCKGDSGGALVMKTDNNTMVQIGIFSFLKGNCSEYPTGHTRVTKFLDFIHNVTELIF